jgi:hypothetical protein
MVDRSQENSDLELRRDFLYHKTSHLIEILEGLNVPPLADFSLLMNSVVEVLLRGNGFSGPFSDNNNQWSNLTNLIVLDLANNLLTGVLPDGETRAYLLFPVCMVLFLCA